MNKKQRTGIFIPLIVICVVSVISVDHLFLREKQKAPDIVGEQSGLSPTDYIEVQADVLQIDPGINRLTIELTFTPHGRFDAGDGVLATTKTVRVVEIHPQCSRARDWWPESAPGDSPASGHLPGGHRLR